MVKKLAFIIILSDLTLTGFCQIPNWSFENWVNEGGYENPESWGTTNSITASNDIFTATKDSSGNPGSYYLKLTSKSDGSRVVNGIAESGTLDTEILLPVSGFPYAHRPKTFTGKWQHMGYGADAATISAWLTKWNSASHQRDTIASLNTTASGMLHTWGIFSIAFTYYSSASPDTAVIQISSSGNTPVKYSFVWIDELAFEGNVLAVDPGQPVSGVSLYPNPSSDFVYINYYSSTNEVVDIKFMDNIGNLVSNTEEVISAGHNQILLNLESHKIHPGIYIVQLISSQGTYSRKLVIKK